MQSADSEDLTRSSNGWGSISVPGGGTSFQGTPIFYIAAYQQQGIDAAGKAFGRFVATGVRPGFAARLKTAGIDLPAHMFQQRVLMQG